MGGERGKEIVEEALQKENMNQFDSDTESKGGAEIWNLQEMKERESEKKREIEIE